MNGIYATTTSSGDDFDFDVREANVWTDFLDFFYKHFSKKEMFSEKYVEIIDDVKLTFHNPDTPQPFLSGFLEVYRWKLLIESTSGDLILSINVILRFRKHSSVCTKDIDVEWVDEETAYTIASMLKLSL